MIHREVIQLSTAKKFFITFVYGKNSEDHRIPLWDSIRTLSYNMDGPWSLVGDFNSVLYQGERIGGVDVQERETKAFAECLQQCNL